MSFIKTYTGKMFDPTNPQKEMIDILDIAHALSLLCRANGHFKNFYSVGQHSINSMKEAMARGYSKRVQLGCLLHDASEAYLSDVTRPIKKRLPEYMLFELPLQNAVFEKYLLKNLNEDEHKAVFDIDNAMLLDEFLTLMDTKLSDDMPNLKVRPDYHFHGFNHTEEEFLHHFDRLTRSDDSDINININITSDDIVVGVDWMNPYWLAVSSSVYNDNLTLSKHKTMRELCEFYKDAKLILIDIPIGLPKNPLDNFRPDKEAKKLLQNDRKSSIFSVSPREVIYAKSKEEAWEISKSIKGKMTPISYALHKMIKEVDLFLQENVKFREVLKESHPEVAFVKLSKNNPPHLNKKTPEGKEERIKILESLNFNVKKLLVEVKDKEIPDVLDALALCATAKLGMIHGFTTIPENPQKDELGLSMQMVFVDFAK